MMVWLPPLGGDYEAPFLNTPKALHTKAQGRPEPVEGRTLGLSSKAFGYPAGVKQNEAHVCNAFGVNDGFQFFSQGAPLRDDPGLRCSTASRFPNAVSCMIIERLPTLAATTAVN
jgi:hypothetical protein